MKVFEIVNEASLADLVRAGQEKQKQFVSQTARGISDKIGVAFNKLPLVNKLQQAARSQTDKANLEKAKQITAKWEEYLGGHPAAQATVAAYQTELTSWLENYFNQPVSAQKVKEQVLTKNPAAVVRFLAQIILPDLYNHEFPTLTPIPPKEPGEV